MGLIPSSSVYVVQHGMRGVVIWAVQRALNQVLSDPDISESGYFGDSTKDAVEAFQVDHGLLDDGKFGPKSSAAMALELEGRVSSPVPVGLVRGVVHIESGDLIGAVNARVAGGIDCGYTQRRVLEADYGDRAVVRRAFDGLYQMNLLARTLKSRHDSFFGRPGARTHQLAWRLAALNHNYPYAADQISRKGVSGLSDYFQNPQSWVEAIGAKFPDGAPIRTPLEWCQHYALGSTQHGDPGLTTQFVSDWIV